MTAIASLPAPQRDLLHWGRPGVVAPAELEASPGEIFAAAVASVGSEEKVSVPFSAHLPAAFPLFASRPRYTVRHLLKTAHVSDERTPHVYEPPKSDTSGVLASGTSYANTPESGFEPRVEYADLTDLSVEVDLPAGLRPHQALLATYLDYRVLVRLSVVENQSLLHGSPDGVIQGLLRTPGTRSIRTSAGLDEAVLAAAAQVEETGGSCDGIVAHPQVYWQMAESGLLTRLQASGVSVSRTRMMPADRLLLGDFSAAATLLIPSVASIELLPGEGADGGDVVRATTRVGLAVHLPQHLLLLDWDDQSAKQVNS